MGLLDSDPAPPTPDTADAETDTDTADPPDEQGADTVSLQNREIQVPVAGETVSVDPADTVQPADEGGTWLNGSGVYGRPRGVDAVQNRQIVQTSAMQSIVNGVAGQIVGGDLAFDARDGVMDDLSDTEQEAAGDLRTLLRDVLEGPHVPDLSLDQLIVSAIEDMMGPGQAVWQPLESASGEFPVVALQTLDPLTVRMNIDRHNQWGDPPYWQAPGAFAGGTVSQLQSVEPVPLQHDEVILMDYPYGTRSYKTYPISPAWQVREWLEILANSTTHHNRFYDDNEIPPGLLQVVNASDKTIEDITSEIQQASGDPRDVPVVGGEGGAQWLDMGGSAINLNIIEEQKWFFYMCLGALGLGKAEVGMIEDVNRSNGEVEATRVYKRVAGPFIDQFADAMRAVCNQFDAYRALGQPFAPTIALSDPREERAREERLRKQLQAGAITPRQYARRTGDEGIAEDDDRWTVELNGETIQWGDKPMWVAKRLFSAAGATDLGDTGGDGDPDTAAAMPTTGGDGPDDGQPVPERGQRGGPRRQA
jgi:phage portal protein BeeE